MYVRIGGREGMYSLEGGGRVGVLKSKGGCTNLILYYKSLAVSVKWRRSKNPKILCTYFMDAP